MILIWYQRLDGLWNAECGCGATICGTRDAERRAAERWHFERADEDRKNNNKYKPCEAKIPTPDPNLPGPFTFR